MAYQLHFKWRGETHDFDPIEHIMRETETACDILAYLIRNPHAKDTMQGIIEWWLFDQRIEKETTRVNKALAELVASGLILERKIENSETVYRINEGKLENIRELLKRHNLA